MAPDPPPLEVHGLEMGALVGGEVHDGVVLEAELLEGGHQGSHALVHLLHVVPVAEGGGLGGSHAAWLRFGSCV